MMDNVKGLKVALHNLGCKVNSYEMDVMSQKLAEAGCDVVSFDESADVYIINTCTVTNIADRKSRQMLHRAKKANPDAIVVAVGCYVETGMDGVRKDPAIDLAIGNNKKSEVAEILDEFIGVRKAEAPGSCEVDKTLSGSTVIDINHTSEYEEMKLRNLPEHTRAYIKIQDGCNQFCTYCVIPYARGRVRSRDEKDILEEIESLSKKGCKEIVLTGIHVGSYGIDNGRTNLIDLIEKIDAIEGISRIRLGSVEPRLMNEENIRRMAGIRKLCPHFHLSLQSGCDSVLKRMNRHYTADEYRKSVELIRRSFDRPAITTDVIVGFPGETEEEFEECRKFAEDIGFYEMHVFKYSPRKGTVAAGMPDQLTDREKTKRSDVLLELTARDSRNYRKSFLSEELSVLWEDKEVHDGRKYMIGHTDRYIRVAVGEGSPEFDGAVSGSITCVTPNDLLDDDTLLI